MAKKPQESAEAAKTRKLRELREANEAARRAKGLWGLLGVGEIEHPTSKTVFVMCVRGRDAPDPAKHVRARSPLVPADDYPALVEWLNRRPLAEYRSRLVAWDLSDQEAKRIRTERIDAVRAAGSEVINPTAVVRAPA